MLRVVIICGDQDLATQLEGALADGGRSVLSARWITILIS